MEAAALRDEISESAVIFSPKGFFLIALFLVLGVFFFPTLFAEAQESPSMEKIGDKVSTGGSRVIRVPHPGAAQGLVKINEDRSYEYEKRKTKSKEKSLSFGTLTLTPPRIFTQINQNTLNYESVYGGGNIYGIQFSHEWILSARSGMWGSVVELGLAFKQGNGILVQPQQAVQAREALTLVIVPLGFFMKYRFEYSNKPWIVPYIEVGGVYYGLTEIRSDGQSITVAGAPAVGGGGGMKINISKQHQTSLSLEREYGISDMWLNVGYRSMTGVKGNLNFTNTTLNAGLTVDF